MRRILRACIAGAAFIGIVAAANIAAERADAQRRAVQPPFEIWDVELGTPVSAIPEIDVIEIACGTNGGPQSRPLPEFEAFTACNPEETGLYEVSFGYDDELDYIALAMDSEYAALRDGTSVYAHPVILSVLIDEQGIIQGLRIMTDTRIPARERRQAVTLLSNFEARFSQWSLACEDIPLAEGEMPVGNRSVKRTCSGLSPDGTAALRLDGSYLRKKGQSALNRETRKINASYFESLTRLEMVLTPNRPSPPKFGGT